MCIMCKQFCANISFAKRKIEYFPSRLTINTFSYFKRMPDKLNRINYLFDGCVVRIQSKIYQQFKQIDFILTRTMAKVFRS